MTYFMIALEVKYLIEKESELLRKMWKKLIEYFNLILHLINPEN